MTRPSKSKVIRELERYEGLIRGRLIRQLGVVPDKTYFRDIKAGKLNPTGLVTSNGEALFEPQEAHRYIKERIALLYP
ncbi:MAG: hypothetical protein IIA59_00465 [Candidatus Marinimicrobia bacterium]|nr:hypothetical protein [Candidatus Neomarinimicrobiota bacterium]